MVIKKYEKNGYVVLKIMEDIGIRTPIVELKTSIDEYLGKSKKYFAISFTPNSYFNSEAVSICVQCIEAIRESSGKLAFIKPNVQILEVLRIIGLTEFVEIANSESDLHAPLA